MADEGPATLLPASSVVDHLVFGVPDLEEGIERLAGRLGVCPAVGGRHAGFGTRNALLGLGGERYLELLAPDPQQEVAASWLGMAGLTEPRLLTWAARSETIDRQLAWAAGAGLDLGVVRSMERRTPQGQTLRWRLTVGGPGGPIPFLISWGRSPHPGPRSPAGCTLRALRAEHPDPPLLRRQLSALGIDLRASEGPGPALIAALETPRGSVMLR